MRFSFLSIFIHTILGWQLAHKHAFAQNITVTEKQFVIPILKGKSDNPVIRLQVWVSPSQPSVSVSGFDFNTTGTTSLKDLKNSKLYFSGTDSAFKADPAKLVAQKEITKGTFSLSTAQTLGPGNHYFWLALELSEKADLKHFVDINCSNITVNQQNIRPKASPILTKQRIGVAVRQHGDDNVHTFRIPGLVTTHQGTLLAVYDARRNSSRDLQGDIDIGLSRSTDGGKTWEPMRIAMDMGTWGGLPQKFNGVSDACILVDKNSNTIYLAGLWMYGVINDQGKWLEGLNENSKEWNHQWRTKGSQPGFDVKQTSQFLIVKSTDDGKTWSEPVNITKMCKKEAWWLWAPAPGHGITLEDGTLVFPTQGRDHTGEAFSNITYSQDGGKTWQTSPKASIESTTENMAAQLSDGSIMLNMRANKNRNDTSARNGREVATTRDLGNTWTRHPSSDGALPEPTCMGSLHRHDFVQNKKKKSILLFSNPNSKVDRTHITLKTSLDDGLTWPSDKWLLLDELKGRGYSCLTSLNENTIGIIYESSQADLVFQQIDLSEILKK